MRKGRKEGNNERVARKGRKGRKGNEEEKERRRNEERRYATRKEGKAVK